MEIQELDLQLTTQQQQALKSLKIEHLNEMQKVSIESCRTGNDMILLSPTGSGKTLAYLLPLLERISTGQCDMPQAVVILPTRELARQVADVWRGFASGINIVCLHGGRSVIDEQQVFSGAKPLVIIGTPGRINDHLTRRNIRPEFIETLVIDEFDKSLELGFQDEMQQILEQLPSIKRKYLLSATDAAELHSFVDGEKLEKLDFRNSNQQPQIRTLFYKVSTTHADRLKTLFSLLCSTKGEQAIVFCNFRESVEDVQKALSSMGYENVAYHGGMEQKERELALYKFRSGSVPVLISTDIAARGLDIPQVRHVIHFQRPLTEDAYTHRNGRTARWDAGGMVYFIALEGKQLPEYIDEDTIEFEFTQKDELPKPSPWVVLYVAKGKKDKLSKGDLAGFFMKKGGLKAADIGPIAIFDRYAYAAVRRDKVKTLMQSISGEKIKGMKTLIEPMRD